jgi:hypothetical protein
MTLCSLVDMYRRFGGNQYLHLQDKVINRTGRSQWETRGSHRRRSFYSLIRKGEIINSSEILVNLWLHCVTLHKWVILQEPRYTRTRQILGSDDGSKKYIGCSTVHDAQSSLVDTTKLSENLLLTSSGYKSESRWENRLMMRRTEPNRHFPSDLLFYPENGGNSFLWNVARHVQE